MLHKITHVLSVATFTPQGSLTSLTTDWLRQRDKSHADPLEALVRFHSGSEAGAVRTGIPAATPLWATAALRAAQPGTVAHAGRPVPVAPRATTLGCAARRRLHRRAGPRCCPRSTSTTRAAVRGGRRAPLPAASRPPVQRTHFLRYIDECNYPPSTLCSTWRKPRTAEGGSSHAGMEIQAHSATTSKRWSSGP